MNNIEVFNQVVATVFKELYENFPKPVVLQVKDIRTKAMILDEDWWEMKSGTKANPVYSAVIWLQEEGYLRFTTHSAPTIFHDVILTSKGFAALNKAPESLTTQPTIGERLRAMTGTMTKDGVGELVKFAFASAFT
jgi:hypothetical protein